MLYRFENGEVLPVPDEEMRTEQTQKFWGVFTPEEFFCVKGCPIADEASFSQAIKSRSLKFESHECFDLICLNRLNYRNVLLGQQRMLVILRRGLIAVISPDAALLAEFTDADALKAYDTHPEHMKIREFVKKVRISRTSVDFDE
jgi:hypothetical protein